MATPNAYAIPKALGEITLADIEKHFPLMQYEPKSAQMKAEDFPFHFRFKFKYNNSSVWLDMNNRKIKVPKFDNKIIMKVTRKNPKYPQANSGSEKQ